MKPVADKVNSDERNSGIIYNVHYKNYIQPKVLIFNLKEVSGEKASVDVFRALLHTSVALKDKQFETIELSFKDNLKFTLKGDYFQKLGNEFEIQNSIYTLRTFPENLLDSEGKRVYGQWEGGMIGVLNKQMEDFQDFSHKWYINESLKIEK